MNHLKKFSLLILLIATTYPVSAQLTLRGGLNLSNIAINSDFGNLNTKLKPGFYFGISSDILISEKVIFEPGILFNTKGFRTKFDFFGESAKSRSTMFYTDVFFNVKPRFALINGGAIFLTAGPYVGLGLFGRDVTIYDGERETYSIDWNEDGLNRFDFGVNLGAGFEFTEQLDIDFRYTLGLANITADSEDGSSHHRILSLGMGWKLGNQR